MSGIRTPVQQNENFLLKRTARTRNLPWENIKREGKKHAEFKIVLNDGSSNFFLPAAGIRSGPALQIQDGRFGRHNGQIRIPGPTTG